MSVQQNKNRISGRQREKVKISGLLHGYQQQKHDIQLMTFKPFSIHSTISSYNLCANI